jgi:CubicO group peptidase (beta-lactamase class C family)
MVQRQVPSIAVAVAKGDKILWEEGFGWADREGRIPADANTLYSIASISKPMTATALMTLVKSGKLDLDKPINDYLGGAKLRARMGDVREATVRRVANHSAGLPEHYQFFYEDEPWRPPSPDETILRFGNLFTPPGESYRYSNLGYGILSYVISRLSGRSYSGYMRQEVFLKLGMNRTSVSSSPALKPFQAIRYGDDGQPITPYEFDHDGASAIYSSVHDLARFGMFHVLAHLPDQAPILPDAMIQDMQKPTIQEGPDVGYGIGWEVDNSAGTAVISHSGGMPGVNTWLRMVPSEKLTIVVLANADERLAHTISDRILNMLLPSWKIPQPTPSAAPAQFAPPRELIGVWKGAISTYESEIPLTVRIQESGDIHVELDNQLKTILNNARFQDGYLRGSLAGSLGIKDAARRPYVLSLNLKLRNGNVLNGAVSARADQSGAMPASEIFPSLLGTPHVPSIQKKAFILTQWAEVSKQ